MRRRRWITLAAAAVLAAAVIWLWPFLLKLPAWFEIIGKRSYNPEACMENMRYVGRALQLYLESEDAYPPAGEWMDKISLYLRSQDLSKKDQQKKLRCPDLDGGPDVYGYAFNGAISSLWSDEVSNPAETPAIYDSEKTERNAHDAKAFESLPKTPRAGGNNVVWADGHASAAPAADRAAD